LKDKNEPLINADERRCGVGFASAFIAVHRRPVLLSAFLNKL